MKAEFHCCLPNSLLSFFFIWKASDVFLLLLRILRMEAFHQFPFDSKTSEQALRLASWLPHTNGGEQTPPEAGLRMTVQYITGPGE